jgi:transposase-like protein
MLRMEQVYVIRHKVLRKGQSVRQVARELGVSRNTIGKYLRQPEPVRERRARTRPVWERVKPRLDELLAEWEPRTTAKQRLTGTRLQRQLAAERYAIGTTLIGVAAAALRKGPHGLRQPGPFSLCTLSWDACRRIHYGTGGDETQPANPGGQTAEVALATRTHTARCGGIDCGEKSHYVAVPRERDPQPVREFRTLHP